MTTICAWCNKKKQDSTSADERVSHGICKECLAWMKSMDRGRNLREILDTLPAPVLVVNDEGRISEANSLAAARFNGNGSKTFGMRGGDFLECMNARLPGGCGNTVHCRSCTIRNTVMATFEDGEFRERVPAYIDTIEAGQEKKVRFLVSTVRVKDMVWLRIEDAG